MCKVLQIVFLPQWSAKIAFSVVHNLSAKKRPWNQIFLFVFCFLQKSIKIACLAKKRGKFVTNLKSSRMKTASMFAVHIFAIIGLCLSSGLGYKYSNKEEPLRGILSSEISMIFCHIDFTWNHFWLGLIISKIFVI